MGVFAMNQTVNIAALAAEMRTAVGRWFNGTVTIFDPNTEDGAFNRASNTVTGKTETILWTGPAQIRIIRRPVDMRTEYSKTDIRSIIVQLPPEFDFGDNSDGVIRAGLRLRVEDGGEDPTMQHFVYVIRSGVNSSGMWTRTLVADTDFKALV